MQAILIVVFGNTLLNWPFLYLLLLYLLLFIVGKGWNWWQRWCKASEVKWGEHSIWQRTFQVVDASLAVLIVLMEHFKTIDFLYKKLLIFWNQMLFCVNSMGEAESQKTRFFCYLGSLRKNPRLRRRLKYGRLRWRLCLPPVLRLPSSLWLFYH